MIKTTSRCLGKGRLWLLVAASLSPAACSPPRLPDVLLVSLDSTRADTLDLKDPALVPNLARIAPSGTRFEQAISGSSWTLPSHVQMFTGQPPALHGVNTDDIGIDPLTPLLPELLHAAGYFTAGFYTGWYLSREYGYERGFDLYENAMTNGAAVEAEYQAAIRAGEVQRAQQLVLQRGISGHADITSRHVFERLSLALQHAPQEQPTFLFAHFFDPHYDYLPPAPWDRRFDPGYKGEYDGRGYYENLRIFDPSKRPARQIPQRDLQHIYALYRGELGSTDESLGAIFEELEHSGRLENTLLIVTADHGEEFFEHGGRGHRQSLYDEVLRVPLWIRLPASLRVAGQPSVISAQVSLSDLMPTVLDVLGLECPPSVFGRSLLPALQGQPLESRPELSSLMLVDYKGPQRGFLLQVHESLRTPERKLIRTLSYEVLEGLRPDLGRLYDLKLDPGEQRPLYDPSAPELIAAWAEIEVESQRLRDFAARLPHTPTAERVSSAKDLFAGELAALGYVSPDVAVSPGLSAPWGLGPLPEVPQLPAPLQPPGPTPQGSPGS